MPICTDRLPTMVDAGGADRSALAPPPNRMNGRILSMPQLGLMPGSGFEFEYGGGTGADGGPYWTGYLAVAGVLMAFGSYPYLPVVRVFLAVSSNTMRAEEGAAARACVVGRTGVVAIGLMSTHGLFGIVMRGADAGALTIGVIGLTVSGCLVVGLGAGDASFGAVGTLTIGRAAGNGFVVAAGLGVGTIVRGVLFTAGPAFALDWAETADGITSIPQTTRHWQKRSMSHILSLKCEIASSRLPTPTEHADVSSDGSKKMIGNRKEDSGT